MEKLYKIRICFGNGQPLETNIKAKNGIAAQDQAVKAHPGARSVHVLSATPIKPKKPPAPKKTPPKPAAVKPVAPKPLTPNLSSIIIEDEYHPLFTDVSMEEVKQYVNKDRLHKLQQVQLAVELRGKGLTHRQIAASLGIGSTTVGNWLKQHGSR